MAQYDGTYVTLAEARAQVGLSESDPATDDSLLGRYIDAAEKFIEGETGFTFTATTATRKYHAIDDIEDLQDPRILRLGYPLLSVTTLTNGDGNTISSDDYVLLPTNESPKWEIEIKRGASTRWQYSTTPEEAISVAGTWGYSSTCPKDIKEAILQLVNILYKGKDTQLMGTVAIMSNGQLVFREGMPLFLALTIARYKNLL